MRATSKALIAMGGILLFSTCARISPSLTAASFNVMSYNIRYHNPEDGENAWPHRRALVSNTIRFHQADFAGLQEALKGQMDDLSALLPEYAWLGVGRDDGREKGEYSAILYRKDRFEVLQHGAFWLSETPEQAGSIGWDAAITRIVTWAKFKDRQTGKTFFLFNTHFDHVGERARRESAKLLLSRIHSLAPSEPVIVTGDFNATEASPVYRILAGNATDQTTLPQARLLTNARDMSSLPHYGPSWTFHGFGRAPERTGIDYIFVSRRVKVLRHGVIADSEGGPYASDHLAVLAEVLME